MLPAGGQATSRQHRRCCVARLPAGSIVGVVWPGHQQAASSVLCGQAISRQHRRCCVARPPAGSIVFALYHFVLCFSSLVVGLFYTVDVVTFSWVLTFFATVFSSLFGDLCVAAWVAVLVWTKQRITTKQQNDKTPPDKPRTSPESDTGKRTQLSLSNKENRSTPTPTTITSTLSQSSIPAVH